MTDQPRLPELCKFYQQYLNDEDTARYITSVASQYSIGTLERLAEFGSRVVRRSAVLSLGFLADIETNALMGRRMNDVDRGVRVLAENGIRELWCRDGDDVHRQQLRNRDAIKFVGTMRGSGSGSRFVDRGRAVFRRGLEPTSHRFVPNR